MYIKLEEVEEEEGKGGRKRRRYWKRFYPLHCI